jgi:hypothetical protein
MKDINYKGKGEHSVNDLELIIEQQAEELHLIKSGQTEFSIPNNIEKAARELLEALQGVVSLYDEINPALLSGDIANKIINAREAINKALK